MKYFFKAIALSLRYKWTLLASVLNALLIGVLWGASITTVYPFVEVVFEGKTVETWLDGRILEANDRSERLAAEMEDLQQRLGDEDPDGAVRLRSQIEVKTARKDAEERAAAYYESIRPWAVEAAPKTAYGTLALLMALLVAATVVKGVCLVLNAVLVARVANRTVMDMRRMFYRDALEMDQKTADQLGTTNLMTMLSHNIGLVNGGLRSLYGKSVREPLKMIACLVAASLISWRLLVLSLLVAPLGILCIHYLSRRMKRAAVHEMGGIAAVFHTLIETFNGLSVVKIFNRERAERYRFKQNARTLYRLSMKISFYDSLIRPITELVGVLSIVVAILAGAYLVLNQETHLFGIRISNRPLSPSALFMFYAMLAGISDPARKMSDIYNVLVRAAMASRSLYTVFENEPQVVASEKRVPVPLHAKSIRFENVCFAYRPLKRVLHRVDLEIEFGQTVAVVGENGCGKTTLARLLARFYDPVEGNIYLDGVNLRDVNPKKLRRQFALVTQEPVLFRGTVWDNILYGAPQASRNEILAAARIAGVEDFIRQCPKGYETPVGDQGKFLSGGQRQRVALARAVACDPRILIFDEATSQIDQRAERALHDSLRQFLKGRTTILITHRPSTLELADRVVVMHKGQIVKYLPAAKYRTGQEPPFTPVRKAA